MDFRQLEYVITIEKERTLLAAAEKLFLSPSALSQHITKLEQEMQGSMNEALDKLEQSMSQNGEGDQTGEGEGKGEEPPEEDLPPKQPGSDKGEPVDTSDVNYGDQDDDPYNIAIKDGETPYTDEYDAYFKQEMAKLEGLDMTDEEKEMIARYYASIRMEMENE